MDRKRKSTQLFLDRLLKIHGFDGLRIADNSTPPVNLMAVKKKDKKCHWQTRYQVLTGDVIETEALMEYLREELLREGLLEVNGAIDTTHAKWRSPEGVYKTFILFRIVENALLDSVEKGHSINLVEIVPSGNLLYDPHFIELIEPHTSEEKILVELDLAGQDNEQR